MSKNTEIKICGLTRPEEAEYLNECGVDYAGFVFFEKSKRNISFEKAATIMSKLDRRIKRVAVVVSPDIPMIVKIMEYDFDIIQIHGEISVDVLKTAAIPVWIALNLSEEDEMCEKLKFYAQIVDKYPVRVEGIVMDAPNYGSGQPFNWHRSRRLLKAGDRSSPHDGMKLILAGGLNSSNVAEGIEIFDPDVVDVSTGVEGDLGKSYGKIRDFVDAVRL